jgi:hypothetical protein
MPDVMEAPAPPTDTPDAPAGPKPIDNAEVAKTFKGKIESARRNSKDYRSDWKRNVEVRLGKPITTLPSGVLIEDEIQAEVNPDWGLVKTKTANLYSQVPTVQGTHENNQYAAAVAPFMKSLNYELGEKRANVRAAMKEALNDVVNASGVAVALVGYAARFETVKVPGIDTKTIPPDQLQQMQASGQIPMVDAQRVASDKIFVTRISPVDFLWPVEFTGSCFDDADWLGHKGRMSWAEAVNEFKPGEGQRGITEEDKQKVLGASETSTLDDLRTNPESRGASENKVVTYDRLYYWRARVDPEEKQFKAIWELVYVDGVEDPVLHRPCKCQQYDAERRKYAGACKLPLRVLTLTYISDNPIPPSDSAVIRPQVNDLRRSRSQMFQNRERSTPLRWFDTNRVDGLIQDNLMRGHIQGMIPMNGNGGNAIGEIARASYPAEDFTFDQMTKADIQETVGIGPQQSGAQQTGERATKAEVQTIQANFATKIGEERAEVAYFFLGIAEVVAGFMALYSDFPILTDQERTAMQQVWDNKHILHDLVLKIRPDAAVMIDVQSRIDRLDKFVNMYAKSGLINVPTLITERAELTGFDPAQVLAPPKPPPPPPPPNLTLNGKDDLANPMVMGMLVKHQQAPSVDHIKEGKKLLVEAQQGAPAPPTPPQGQQGPQPPHPGEPHPPPTAHKDWNSAPKIIKRDRDR